MKTTKKLSGLAIFAMGVVFTLVVSANARHYDFKHHAGIRKSAVIEVGAPLTVPQMKNLGLI